MSVININKELFCQKLNKCQFAECTKILRSKFKLVRNEDNKLTSRVPSDTSIDVFGYLLDKLTPDIENEEYEENEENKEKLLLIKQCFQSLRNCAACGESVQNKIIQKDSIIINTCKLLGCLQNMKSQIAANSLVMLLQFLSNVIVNNFQAQAKIIEHCFDDLCIALFSPEISHIVSIIVYNILKNNSHLIEGDIDFVNNVIMLLTFDVDNITLILELLVEKNMITSTYKDLMPDDRITVLEYIHGMQIQEVVDIPLELIVLMADEFKRGSDCILKTVKDYVDHIAPLEVTRLLDCIANASSHEKFLPTLQKDASLLINAIFLLKNMHVIGKEGDNEFTAIQKLSELKLEDSPVQEHPTFGFKASLIRVIANLCWKHQKNKELVYELDCIPVLLDCCNIDARNPLIIQWVIYAIRNLCENNDVVKAQIAGMTKVGVVNSAIVREMGLMLHDDGKDKICIAPLNLNK